MTKPGKGDCWTKLSFYELSPVANVLVLESKRKTFQTSGGSGGGGGGVGGLNKGKG